MGCPWAADSLGGGGRNFAAPDQICLASRAADSQVTAVFTGLHIPTAASRITAMCAHVLPPCYTITAKPSVCPTGIARMMGAEQGISTGFEMRTGRANGRPKPLHTYLNGL